MREEEYDAKAMVFLEMLWGDGFLSPGGPEEVERIIAGIDFSAKAVLDIGCGSGGITCYLARTKGLAAITGFDVEAPVLTAARRRADECMISDRVRFVAGEPGPLPFENCMFDIVFSKDALVHVHDKEALFADIFRVLKPGGIFAASDWLTSHDGEPSFLMKAYLAAEGLSFGMASADRYEQAMRQAGFSEISCSSRNAWYLRQARLERDRLKGDLYDRIAGEVGAGYVDKNIRTWEAMLEVLASGEHCPTHLRAYRPQAGKVIS